MTFESGFTDTERAASSATKVVATLATAIKQLMKAASEGEIAKMRKAAERMTVVLESARQEVENARAAWPFSPESEEIYLRDSYVNEILEAAQADGIQIQRRDEGLVAFPLILRVVPPERTVLIDRRKVHAVRPSRLIKAIKAIQSAKPKLTSENFLEVLYRAYRLIAEKEYGITITLVAIYEALTLLPGSNAIYDRTEFVRDLFLLDRSGVTRTKSGARFSLPASTGTKGAKGKYWFVAPDGETVTYYGIQFSEETE